jgi:hypothetical protein
MTCLGRDAKVMLTFNYSTGEPQVKRLPIHLGGSRLLKQGVKSTLALKHFCPHRLSAPGGILQHGTQPSSLK